MSDDLPISSRITIPEKDLSWTAARSSGPGGQNVNKVASKVDLRFDLEGCEVLRPPVKARLRAIPGVRLDADGRVMIAEQGSRDQSRNLEEARSRLAGLIRRALTPPKRRKKTKVSRRQKRKRLEAKRKHSQKKKMRGKVKRGDW